MEIRKIIREIVSEVLNKQLAYHGSNFLDSDDKKNYVPSGYYPGTYYFIGSDAEEKANKFGKHISNIEINDLKLFDVDDEKDADKLKNDADLNGFHVNQGSGTGETKYLKSIGYDGIRRGNEIIVF